MLSKTSVWQKYLLRHGLFAYGRDTLIFFINLYIWDQERDLRMVALFNIIYLSSHTSMFFLGLPFVRRVGGIRMMMRIGLIWLAVCLAAVAALQTYIVDYIFFLAAMIGFPNGMYWLANHTNSFDLSSNENRAAFISLRNGVQGSARLAVPFMGWIGFTFFTDVSAGYTFLFGMGLIAMSAAVFLVDIPHDEKLTVQLKESVRAFSKAPLFWLKMMSGFLYGLSVRSILPTVLLPFLVFQVVEREDRLSMFQTGVELLAICAVFLFARYKAGSRQINRLLVLYALSAVIGVAGLMLQFSIETYVLFVLSYVVSLSTANIALGTVSNNYLTLIPDYAKHRVHFMAIREPFSIAGFACGYVFVYFYNDLEITSLRPLLIIMLIATVLCALITRRIWQYVE